MVYPLPRPSLFPLSSHPADPGGVRDVSRGALDPLQHVSGTIGIALLGLSGKGHLVFVKAGGDERNNKKRHASFSGSTPVSLSLSLAPPLTVAIAPSVHNPPPHPHPTLLTPPALNRQQRASFSSADPLSPPVFLSLLQRPVRSTELFMQRHVPVVDYSALTEGERERKRVRKGSS